MGIFSKGSSGHDRVKLNIARTAAEKDAAARLPKADSKSRTATSAARARGTNNHPGRG